MKLAKKLAQLYHDNIGAMYLNPIDQRLKRLDTFIHNRREITKHLLWMCKEIKNCESWHETKAHRWIGFIQGALWAMRVFTIDDLRGHVNDAKHPE